MVDKAKVKIYLNTYRHSMNLPSKLVNDSAFPFKINEELIIKIKGKKLIIEREENDKKSLKKITGK